MRVAIVTVSCRAPPPPRHLHLFSRRSRLPLTRLLAMNIAPFLRFLSNLVIHSSTGTSHVARSADKQLFGE